MIFTLIGSRNQQSARMCVNPFAGLWMLENGMIFPSVKYKLRFNMKFLEVCLQSRIAIALHVNMGSGDLGVCVQVSLEFPKFEVYAPCH